MASLAALLVVTVALWFGTLWANAMNCGYHTTGLKGIIPSPIAKGGSLPNSRFQCVWTITVPLLNRIRLELQESDIAGRLGGQCTSDWLLVESITGSGRSILHDNYCGTYSDVPTIVSAENQLRIRYNYDNHYYDKKPSYFTLKYAAVPLTKLEVATYWIEKELKKENLPKAVSSLFLVNGTYFRPGNAKAENITNQFRLQLGEDLVRNVTRPMPAGDIAVRISALLAACINPRSFYGVDLVHHLRKLVNNVTGIPNPYFFLTLCNSGVKLTSRDVKKLTEVIDNQKHEMFWIDYQAMALLALVCVKEQNYEHHIKNKIEKAAAEIKSFQLKDGGFGSLQTTSLVIQALSAAEGSETGWNRSSAIGFINAAKHSDGSFGNIQNLYAVAPVVSGKTILYINASKCDFTNDDGTSVNEIRANHTQPIQIEYSLWIGDHIDVTSTVALKAPNGTRFLDFMRLAADKDEKFKFRWINMKNSPYVYEIGGLINDPSIGKYWTLYVGKHMLNLERFSKGLEHYIPKHDEKAVMWYKTVDVEHSWKEDHVLQEE